MKVLFGSTAICLLLLAGVGSAATIPPTGSQDLGHAPKLPALPEFPEMLAAARVVVVAPERPRHPNRATLAVEMAVVMGGTIALANALPRNRRRRRKFQPRAAREMSWIRCTMARNPFDRWAER